MKAMPESWTHDPIAELGHRIEELGQRMEKGLYRLMLGTSAMMVAALIGLIATS